MKRPIDDAGDRAYSHQKQGLVRIPLPHLGFWPGDRGGIGVCAFHVHEVAHDCVTNRTKRHRYDHVDVIEIPDTARQQILDANRELCETTALMPRFSPDIKYVCASKTHFVHAHKLAKDGSRTIYNKGEVPIKWQANDEEGAQILENGPLCIIFGSPLLLDVEATTALCAEDNLNAEVQWGDDEIQAFGRVHEMVERIGSTTPLHG